MDDPIRQAGRRFHVSTTVPNAGMESSTETRWHGIRKLEGKTRWRDFRNNLEGVKFMDMSRDRELVGLSGKTRTPTYSA